MEIELTAPAGNFPSLAAAIKAGADSVYFGLKDLNMRSHGAENFSVKDLWKIEEICRQNKIKSYLTLNSIIYDKDLSLMKKIVDKSKPYVDAIIASDVSVLEYCYLKKIPCHASTQLNISNIESVKIFSKYCDVIVLARELTLKQILSITNQIKKQNIKGPSEKLIKIEIFCHGALCVSVSGKCYMSLVTSNFSANRGQCFQNCRRKYKVVDEQGNELEIDNKYIMSLKDLCTLPFLDKILKSGISILKIEGRARPAEYIYLTTKIYKQAINDIKKNSLTKEKISKYLKELETVFNRGFWHGGYYLGKKLNPWSEAKGSLAKEKKIEIGKVVHYFPKIKVAHISTNKKIKKDDKLLVVGPTTGVAEIQIKEIYNRGKKVKTGSGDEISILSEEKVRKNDKVYLLKDNYLISDKS